MALTVLIVDDHPSFRASARVLLEAEGFDVVGEAEDGESALEAVRRLRPDIVLVSSRDSSDFGPLVARSGARGFVPKAELSGARIHELL